jgi:hypothetical protein
MQLHWGAWRLLLAHCLLTSISARFQYLVFKQVLHRHAYARQPVFCSIHFLLSQDLVTSPFSPPVTVDALFVPPRFWRNAITYLH